MSDYDGTERRDCIPSNQYSSICEKRFDGIDESLHEFKTIQVAHGQKLFNGFGLSIEHLQVQNKRLIGIMISVGGLVSGAVVTLLVAVLTGGIT